MTGRSGKRLSLEFGCFEVERVSWFFFFLDDEQTFCVRRGLVMYV